MMLFSGDTLKNGGYDNQKYRRAFGPGAPWNVPVKNVPEHKKSSMYAERFWNGASSRPGDVNLSFDWYTYPVYYTSDAKGSFYCKSKWKTNIDGKMILWNPEWRAAFGTDGQIILLDSVKGFEWDLWQVKFKDDTVFITNGNLIQSGQTAGDGSDPGNFWTKENGFIPSRGIGVQYLAMLVRPEEIEQGVIEHALSMPIRITDGNFFMAPTTKLEHPGRPVGIPEGMRFALRISDKEIEEWITTFKGIVPEKAIAAAQIIARALRDYGWFITDTSGGCHLQFEDMATAGAKWDALGLGKTEINGKLYPRDLLDGLFTKDRIYTLVPSDQYQK